MENPRTVHRLLVALLVAFTAAAVAAGIYFRTVYIPPGWLAVVAAFFLLCFVIALFTIAVFAPLFWLLAKLDAKLTGKRPHDK